MPDLQLPPPKRTRSRRLRKKLHIGEFQTLGFEYDLIWSEAPSVEVQERFIDQLLEEVIEPRSLALGAALEAWLRQWTTVCHARVGQLQDAWYDRPN